MAKKKTPQADLEAQFEALPDKKPKHAWTPEIDGLMRKYIPIKGVPAVAALLNIPVPTVDGHWKMLRRQHD